MYDSFGAIRAEWSDTQRNCSIMFRFKEERTLYLGNYRYTSFKYMNENLHFLY